MSVARKMITENTEILIEHSPEFDDKISSFYLNPNYSDLTLIVEGEKLHAHKMILGCRNKYFEVLLSNCLEETNSKERYYLKDTPIESFKLLLKYIYTGLIHITNLNDDLACNILILIDRYCIDELLDPLLDFLKKKITIDNVLKIFNIVHRCSFNNLVEDCLLFSDKNASEILRQESFLHLSKAPLIDLLKRDTFLAPEEEISRAAINWCKINENQDIEVLKCLRLSLLNGSELLKLTKELNDINILSLMKSVPEVELPYRGQIVMDENVCKKLISQRSETKDGDTETISISEIIKLETPSFINHIQMSLLTKNDVSYYINAGVDKSKLERIVDYSSYKCQRNTLQFLYFDATLVQFIEIRSKDELINLKNGLEYFTAMYKSNTPKIIHGIICPNYNVATEDNGAKVYLCNSYDMTIKNTESLNSLINGIRHTVSHSIGKECFLIQLAQPYLLSSLRLLLNDDEDDNYYSYYIETSIDRMNWEILVDKKDEQCKSWRNINFPSRKIVYFKIVGTAGPRNVNRNDYSFDCRFFECPSSEKDESKNDNHKN